MIKILLISKLIEENDTILKRTIVYNVLKCVGNCSFFGIGFRHLMNQVAEMKSLVARPEGEDRSVII